MIMKNRSHPQDINRPWHRHRNKYTKSKSCHGKMISICNKQHLSFEIQFIKKLSNTEAKLKKDVAYKKAVL